LLLHGSGPGVSAAEKRTYGRAAWTKHAVSVLDAVGIGQVDVIGNSMGGAVALAMAATRPAAIRRIVLMGSMGVAMALPPGLDAVWGVPARGRGGGHPRPSSPTGCPAAAST